MRQPRAMVQSWLCVGCFLVFFGVRTAIAQTGTTPEPPPAAPAEPPATPIKKTPPAKPLQRSDHVRAAMAASGTFEARIKCGICSGSGETRVEQVVDGKAAGPFRERRKVTSMETCTACSGTGFSKQRPSLDQADKLVSAVAAVPANDPELDKLADKLERDLRSALAGRRSQGASQAWGEVAKRRSNDSPIQFGKPMLRIGYLLSDSVASDGVSLRVGAGPDDFSDVFVLVENPKIKRGARTERVIVGGMFYRHERINGTQVPVVKDGFMLVLP